MKLIRYCLLLCSLAACADQSTDMQAPEPSSAMTAHNKLDYSSETRSLINKYVNHVRNGLKQDHGQLAMENYQVDTDVSFDQIQAHYQSSLEAGSHTWTPMDDPAFAWSDQALAAGWRSGDKVFVVLAVEPQRETDRMPVQTLSNLVPNGR